MLLIVLNDSTTLLRSSSELWVCMSSSCPVSSFTHWTALHLCSGCWCNDLDVLQIGTRGMKQPQVLPSSSTASSPTIVLLEEARVPCSKFLAIKLRHCCSSSSCSSPPLWESPALQTTLLLPSWCTGWSFPFAFDLDYMLLSHMFLERLPSSYITTYNTAHLGLIIQLGLVSPILYDWWAHVNDKGWGKLHPKNTRRRYRSRLIRMYTWASDAFMKDKE